MKWLDIFRLSWRNIAASRRRSLLIIFTIAIALSEVLLIMALRDGLQRLTLEKVTTQSSIVFDVITDPAKSSSAPTSMLDAEGLDKIKNLPQVASATGVISKPGELQTGAANRSLKIYGVDSQFAQVASFSLKNGHMPQKDEAVISQSVATSLGTDPNALIGQPITITVNDIPFAEAPDVKNMVGGLTFTIAGVANDPSDAIWAPLSDIRLFTINEPFSLIKVRAKSQDVLPALTQRLEGLGYAIDSTGLADQQNDAAYKLLNHIRSTVLTSISLVSIAIFIILVFSILTIALYSRNDDMVNLLLIGGRRWDVLKLITVEALTLASIAGTLAVLLSIGLSRLAMELIATMAATGSLASYEVFLFTPNLLVYGIVLSLLVGFVAGNITGWRAVYSINLGRMITD